MSIAIDTVQDHGSRAGMADLVIRIDGRLPHPWRR